MPQASVKRLIETEKEKLIDLVLDIDNYPKFIPYCIDSKVYERNDKGHSIVIIADLTIGKGIFKDTYKSDVRYDKKTFDFKRIGKWLYYSQKGKLQKEEKYNDGILSDEKSY